VIGSITANNRLNTIKTINQNIEKRTIERMKAEELRIGNLVNCNGLSIVRDINPNRLRVVYTLNDNERNSSVPIDLIEPIPLTEEWLIKFGFEEFKGWDDMRFWKVKGEENGERFELFETLQGYESPSGKVIDSVHALQNCYYFHTLTGKELTIKE
jgi:hypothetical protein